MSDYQDFIRQQRIIADAAWAAKNSQKTQTTATLSQESLAPSSEEPSPNSNTGAYSPDTEGPTKRRPSQKSLEENLDDSAEENTTEAFLPTPNQTTPEKSKRKSKLTGYKDRKEIARRMRLDPTDNFAIRERREFVKVQCVRRSQVLDKPFEDFDTAVMYKLVKVVTDDMRTQYGSWWPSDLTRDLIHAICLDKVRNNNARERVKKRKVSPVVTAPTPQLPATKRKKASCLVPPSDEPGADTDIATNKKAPGTTPKVDPLHPLTLDPVTPKAAKAKPETPWTPASGLGSGKLVLPPFSPLESSPPVSGEIDDNQLDHLFSSSGNTTPTAERPQSLPGKDTTTNATTAQSATRNLAIYIAGHRPLQLPLHSSYSEFNDLVSSVLNWGEDKFILYRPASGSRQELTWRAISVVEDYEKLLKTCGNVGVLVKVVQDSWFASDGEDEEEEPIVPTNWQPSTNSKVTGISTTHRKKKMQLVPGVVGLDVSQTKIKNKAVKASAEGASFTQGVELTEGLSTQTLPGPKKRTRKPKASKTQIISDEQRDGPIKRKPGRPRKNPLPLVPAMEPFVPAIEPLPAGSQALPTTSKAGRTITQSERALEQSRTQAAKDQADKLMVARRELKDLKAGFTL